MTQQFKFGDMVKSRMRPNKTLGLVVDAGSNQYSYIIRWAHEKGVSQEHTESLELIPHPDTVRLDWIEKQRATLYHNAREDIKHGIAPVEVKAAAQSEYFGGSTVRQAIDTAMREKAA